MLENNKKIPPRIADAIASALKLYKTPFYLYDEEGIVNNLIKFVNAFSKEFEFREFFAVKALPNPHILNIMRKHGINVDCSSMSELFLAELSGFAGEQIMFTSNNTALEEYKKALDLNAIINIDDIADIQLINNNFILPKLLSIRYTPHAIKLSNNIIGNPRDAKFGVTKEQLLVGYAEAISCGVNRFGIHTMLVSNELDSQCFIDNAEMMFELVNELSYNLDINFEFINLGGGLGIPYLPNQQPINIEHIATAIGKLYKKYFISYKPKIYMENGRYISGPYGYLVSQVKHKKHTYKEYIGIDATMADLMRPGMYKAYHHISLLNSEDCSSCIYDIVGSLCENNDKFAIDRPMPHIAINDILVIHDVGAHSHAMGFNYNGKLRPAELLLTSSDQIKLIRRAETINDYFNTLDFATI